MHIDELKNNVIISQKREEVNDTLEKYKKDYVLPFFCMSLYILAQDGYT